MLIKPKKPTPDFPLFPHAPGQWAKMIKGRLHYFGPCKDAEGSLAGFQAKNEDSSSNKIPSNPKPRKPARTSRSCPCLRAVGKKVCGRLVYFGPWNDPQSAVNKWLDEKEDLLAGRLCHQLRSWQQRLCKAYDRDRVFITRFGLPWEPEAKADSPSAKRWRRF
jgi:hypothetical protein